MEATPHDRMAIPRKRGRPSNAELAAREKPVPAEEAPISVSVTMQGIRCIGCGRHMVPKVESTRGALRYVRCSLCGSRMAVEYDPTGKAASVRRL